MAELSVENQLSNLRPIIIAMMRQEGMDFTVCEIEEEKHDLHHTKYQGATYYGLRIVCRRCNRSPENVGLQ